MSQVKKGLLGALGKADMKLCKARYILLHCAGNSVNSLKDFWNPWLYRTTWKIKICEENITTLTRTREFGKEKVGFYKTGSVRRQERGNTHGSRTPGETCPQEQSGHTISTHTSTQGHHDCHSDVFNTPGTKNFKGWNREEEITLFWRLQSSYNWRRVLIFLPSNGYTGVFPFHYPPGAEVSFKNSCSNCTC